MVFSMSLLPLTSMVSQKGAMLLTAYDMVLEQFRTTCSFRLVGIARITRRQLLSTNPCSAGSCADTAALGPDQDGTLDRIKLINLSLQWS